MTEKEDPLVKAFKELGLKPGEDTWDIVFGGKKRAVAVKHKALEKIAAAKKMSFDNPIIIETDATNRVCVMSVRGHIGDRSEWAIGEAAPYNIDKGTNKQSYPYAMAEKRAKDRVILKLLNVAGDYYSEAESEEFKEENHKPKQTPPPQPDPEREADLGNQAIEGMISEEEHQRNIQEAKIEAADKARHEEESIKDKLNGWASEVNGSAEPEPSKKYSKEEIFQEQFERIMKEIENAKTLPGLDRVLMNNVNWLEKLETEANNKFRELVAWKKTRELQIEGKNDAIIDNTEEIPI